MSVRGHATEHARTIVEQGIASAVMSFTPSRKRRAIVMSAFARAADISFRGAPSLAQRVDCHGSRLYQPFCSLRNFFTVRLIPFPPFISQYLFADQIVILS